MKPHKLLFATDAARDLIAPAAAITGISKHDPWERDELQLYEKPELVALASRFSMASRVEGTEPFYVQLTPKQLTALWGKYGPPVMHQGTKKVPPTSTARASAPQESLMIARPGEVNPETLFAGLVGYYGVEGEGIYAIRRARAEAIDAFMRERSKGRSVSASLKYARDLMQPLEASQNPGQLNKLIGLHQKNEETAIRMLNGDKITNAFATKVAATSGVPVAQVKLQWLSLAGNAGKTDTQIAADEALAMPKKITASAAGKLRGVIQKAVGKKPGVNPPNTGTSSLKKPSSPTQAPAEPDIAEETIEQETYEEEGMLDPSAYPDAVTRPDGIDPEAINDEPVDEMPEELLEDPDFEDLADEASDELEEPVDESTIEASMDHADDEPVSTEEIQVTTSARAPAPAPRRKGLFGWLRKLLFGDERPSTSGSDVPLRVRRLPPPQKRRKPITKTRR